jgi:hypothetical protein
VVPLAVVAAGCLVFVGYTWWTAPRHVITGPDGAVFEFPAFTRADVMSAELERRYGAGGYRLPYPTPALNAEDRATTGGAVGIMALVAGGLWYLACWALGWIIAGFRSD